MVFDLVLPRSLLVKHHDALPQCCALATVHPYLTPQRVPLSFAALPSRVDGGWTLDSSIAIIVETSHFFYARLAVECAHDGRASIFFIFQRVNGTIIYFGNFRSRLSTYMLFYKRGATVAKIAKENQHHRVGSKLPTEKADEGSAVGEPPGVTVGGSVKIPHSPVVRSVPSANQ